MTIILLDPRIREDYPSGLGYSLEEVPQWASQR